MHVNVNLDFGKLERVIQMLIKLQISTWYSLIDIRGGLIKYHEIQCV